MGPAELEDVCEELGERRFRARQILDRLYRHQAATFDEMPELPAAFRRLLSERVGLMSSRVAKVVAGSDDTAKILVELDDGNHIEAALIPTEHRLTVCLSTQVGCPVKCAFCASSRAPFARSLASHEIVEQLLHLARECASGRRITHVVIMGIGEALLNLDAVLGAIERMNCPWAFGIGMRRITLSTVGTPDGMKRLAELAPQFGVAVSLHAPTDELRTRLVPYARGYPLNRLLADAARLSERTGREITFEYLLLSGVNDSAAHAHQLGKLLSGFPCTVNLIRFNSVAGVPFQAPTAPAVGAFAHTLRKHLPRVTVRASRGEAINAACGQLRLRRGL